jgi:hypothetical protein
MSNMIHTKLHLNALFCFAVRASHNTRIIYQNIKSLVFCNKSNKLQKSSGHYKHNIVLNIVWPEY